MDIDELKTRLKGYGTGAQVECTIQRAQNNNNAGFFTNYPYGSCINPNSIRPIITEYYNRRDNSISHLPSLQPSLPPPPPSSLPPPPSSSLPAPPRASYLLPASSYLLPPPPPSSLPSSLSLLNSYIMNGINYYTYQMPKRGEKFTTTTELINPTSDFVYVSEKVLDARFDIAHDSWDTPTEYTYQLPNGQQFTTTTRLHHNYNRGLGKRKTYRKKKGKKIRKGISKKKYTKLSRRRRI